MSKLLDALRLLFLIVGIISSGLLFADYHPPIKPPLYATSSFGEYREGRFHMGVDFRAGMGTPVYSVDDGYVIRVRCGPWGYGKAIYISFRGRFIGIYAHLGSFAEPFQSYVYQIQHNRRSYSIDVTLEKDQLVVKKGQIIGYTGNSGTIHPHLHFELRDSDGVTCLNPVDFGFNWIDLNPPTINSLLIVPGDVNSTVNGRHIPLEIPVSTPSKEISITARGNVAFGVDTYDPESSGCKLGPYRITMKVDNEEICVVYQTKLGYDTSRFGKVAFYPFFEERNYWILWRWGDISSPNYCLPIKGFFSILNREKFFEIMVEDFYRKVCKVAVKVNPENKTNISSSNLEKPQGVYINYLSNFVVLEVVLPKEKNSAEIPEVTISNYSNKLCSQVDVHKVFSNVFEVPWEPPESGKFIVRVKHHDIGSWEQEIYALKRGDTISPVVIDDLRLNLFPDSAFEWLWFTLSEFSLSSGIEGMQVLSNVYSIQPDSMPIDKPIELEFPYPNNSMDTKKVSFYRRSKKGWERVETKIMNNKLLAKVSKFGDYAVLADNTPPKIYDVSIRDGETFTIRRPEISCKISDIGSGVASANVYCDSEWLLGEYDGPRGILKWARDVDLPTGKHTITFETIDYAGFVVKEHRSIIIQDKRNNKH